MLRFENQQDLLVTRLLSVTKGSDEESTIVTLESRMAWRSEPGPESSVVVTVKVVA